MAAKSSPGGFVVATVTNPGSFMATTTHPTGNGYCWDRILRIQSYSAFMNRLQGEPNDRYFCDKARTMKSIIYKDGGWQQRC